MARILILGYGNTLRGDDALGPLAAERLRPLVLPAETLACHQLTPELAAHLAEYDMVIFIDAAAEGEPGTVRMQHLAPDAVNDAASLTHHVHPAALLALARELYGRAPQALLLTAAGEDFSLHATAFSDEAALAEKTFRTEEVFRVTKDTPLSGPATRALDEICHLVPRLIRAFPSGW